MLEAITRSNCDSFGLRDKLITEAILPHGCGYVCPGEGRALLACERKSRSAPDMGGEMAKEQGERKAERIKARWAVQGWEGPVKGADYGTTQGTYAGCKHDLVSKPKHLPEYSKAARIAWTTPELISAEG